MQILKETSLNLLKLIILWIFYVNHTLILSVFHLAVLTRRHELLFDGKGNYGNEALKI